MGNVPVKFDLQITVGSTTKGLMLAQSKGVKHFQAIPMPMFAPRTSIDEAKYSQRPPEHEMVWIQESFHGGIGQKTLKNPSEIFNNATVDTRFKGRAFLGPVWTSTTKPTTTGNYPPLKFAWFKGELYLLCTNGSSFEIWRYLPATATWKREMIKSTPATDLIVGLGYIIIACGLTTKYWYSTDGQTWTQSTLTNAEISYGCLVKEQLWFVKDYNNLFSCIDPSNAGTLSTETVCGDNQYGFTSLSTGGGLLFIGKQDTLGALDSNGKYFDLLPEFKLIPHARNFVNPCLFNNRMYFPVRFGLIEFNLTSGEVRNVSPSYFSPELTDLPAQIYGTTSTPDWLYLALRDPTSTTGVGVIVAGREEYLDGEVKWRWSKLTTAAVISDGATHFPLRASPAVISGVSNAILWYGNDLPSALYSRLPISFQSPYNDSTCTFYASTGAYLETSEYDFGFGDINKAFAKIDTYTSNLSSGHRTIQIYYSIDGGTWTSLATLSSGTLTTSSFPSSATGKKIALRFYPYSDSSSATPGLEKFILHAIIRDKVFWRFVFTIRVADGILDNQRVPLQDDVKSLTDFLATAYTTAWPCTLTEAELNIKTTDHTVILKPTGDGIRTVLNEETRRPEKYYTLEAIEAILT